MLANASLLLAILIGASLPIAATLIICALLLSAIYSPLPLFLAASEIFWKVSTEFTLTSVPLFILLGEILLRAGIAAFGQAPTGQARAVFCGIGLCQGCLIRADGRMTEACLLPARDGLHLSPESGDDDA